MNNNYRIEKLFENNLSFTIFVEQCQFEFKKIKKINDEKKKSIMLDLNYEWDDEGVLNFYKNKYGYLFNFIF